MTENTSTVRRLAQAGFVLGSPELKSSTTFASWVGILNPVCCNYDFY